MKKDKHHILYVDDEARNLTVFKSAFRREYNVFIALSAQEGLEIMKNNRIHLIVSDQRMPTMTGLEFFEIVALKYPNIERVIITAYTDMQNIIKAVNSCGIYRYIIKPWQKEELHLVIKEGLERHRLKEDKAELLQKLQQQNEELEVKVKERTQELEANNLSLVSANQKLQESETKLNSLNQIKDKLLSIVSHDIRAPLATLSGFIDLFIQFQDSFSNEESLKVSKDIKYSVDNLRLLLDNLLTWSYAQIGNQKIKIEAVPICQIIKNNEKLFRPTVEQKDLSLEISLLKEVTYVNGDANMLDFVIRNLINNAVKFSNKGGKITIKVEEIDTMVKISVIDTGVGMSDEILSLLFQEGKHISTQGTDNEKGTGLGLILCKDFVHQQNGSIEAHSKEGEGSTFSFTVPLTKK